MERNPAWPTASLHYSFIPHLSPFVHMINGMTGFGRAAGALSERYLVAVTVKSVNHRFLEPSIRLPEFFWEMESAVRAITSETFSRGKIDISIRVQRTQQPDYNVRINTQIASTIIPQLRSIAEELGLGSTFSGSDLLRVPDLLNVEPIEGEIQEGERDALLRLVRDAFTQVSAMRFREGEALRADIAARASTIRELQQRLSGHRDEIRGELLAAYQQRVKEIAAEAGIEVSQDRIAQEVVVMVEKGDIAEELTRLSHHVEQLEKSMESKEPAGKKLDFVSQEMLREINTMGSKSRAAHIRGLVIELKTEVERIREQVENVENLPPRRAVVHRVGSLGCGKDDADRRRPRPARAVGNCPPFLRLPHHTQASGRGGPRPGLLLRQPCDLPGHDRQGGISRMGSRSSATVRDFACRGSHAAPPWPRCHSR